MFMITHYIKQYNFSETAYIRKQSWMANNWKSIPDFNMVNAISIEHVIFSSQQRVTIKILFTPRCLKSLVTCF